MLLLILHEDKVECAVEDCVYKICHTKVEDEQICDSLHFSVLCINYMRRMRNEQESLTKHNPENCTVSAHCSENHQAEGNVPEYLEPDIHFPDQIILRTCHTTLNLQMNCFSHLALSMILKLIFITYSLYFWLRQELRERQSPSVYLSVRLKYSCSLLSLLSISSLTDLFSQAQIRQIDEA